MQEKKVKRRKALPSAGEGRKALAKLSNWEERRRG